MKIRQADDVPMLKKARRHDAEHHRLLEASSRDDGSGAWASRSADAIHSTPEPPRSPTIGSEPQG